MAACRGCGASIPDDQWTCAGGTQGEMRCHTTADQVRGTKFESRHVTRPSARTRLLGIVGRVGVVTALVAAFLFAFLFALRGLV